MNNQIKKKLLIALVVTTVQTQYIQSSSQEANHSTPIQVPAIVDGTPFGINGHEIRKLLFIRHKVNELLYGTQNPITKAKKGNYIFQGNPYSVAMLADYEIENKPLSTTQQHEISILLQQVIEDFIKIATPFVEQARGVKMITLNFMKEWAEKHQREQSSLLNWAKEKDGHEFDTFRQEVITFGRLDDFCEDLMSFLSDLIQSCPRAWQQFLELQKKKTK